MYEFKIELDYHNSGNSGPSYVATNVKCYHWENKLPKKYDAWLERLRGRDHKKAERLEQYAYENVHQRFWEDAAEQAADAGLGKIYSAGRSGGWLTLYDYPKGQIENLVDIVNSYKCVCGMHFMDHPRGKCLFNAQSFQFDDDLDSPAAVERDVLEAVQLLYLIQQFLNDQTEWARKYGSQEYVHELKFRIDEEMEECRAARATKRKSLAVIGAKRTRLSTSAKTPLDESSSTAV